MLGEEEEALEIMGENNTTSERHRIHPCFLICSMYKLTILATNSEVLLRSLAGACVHLAWSYKSVSFVWIPFVYALLDQGALLIAHIRIAEMG